MYDVIKIIGMVLLAAGAITLVGSVIAAVFVLPLVVPRRLAGYWRRTIPPGRRRFQFQMPEMMTVWLLVMPPMALAAYGIMEDPYDVEIYVIGAVALAAYMAAGAYAGWAYARYRTSSNLPPAWYSSVCMIVGSVIPPVYTGVMATGLFALLGGYGPEAIFPLALVVIMLAIQLPVARRYWARHSARRGGSYWLL